MSFPLTNTYVLFLNSIHPVRICMCILLLLRQRLFFFSSSFNGLYIETKASFLLCYFLFTVLRFMNEGENKCRNLAVLKSCCNEASKRKFIVITCNAIADIVTDALQRTTIFCQADRKSTWKFRISFTIYLNKRERKKVTEERIGRKMHWKFFVRLFFVEIVRRHFNWVYYTRS